MIINQSFKIAMPLCQIQESFRQLYLNETALKISNPPFLSLKLRSSLSDCQLFSYFFNSRMKEFH